MKLSKCPRCELNYITEGETYCKICRMEMKGEPIREEIEMCTVCGEHPAMPGKDVCLFCHKEMNDEVHDDREHDGLTSATEASLGIDPISTMDEIIPESGEDDEMSLQALAEEEDDEDLDEEDDI